MIHMKQLSSNIVPFLVIGLSVVVLVIAGFFVFSSNESNTTNKPTDIASANATFNEETLSQELVIGTPDAPATIVEYADYKCSQCNNFHQTAGKELRQQYIDAGMLKIVFRPYPVYGEDAGRALYGSYCANEQGKFTAYHDAAFDFMYDNYFSKNDYNGAIQDVFTVERLTTIATEIGMDKSQFVTCLNGDTYNEVFEKVLFASGDDEVQGTPTFIVNGQKIVGAQPFSVFKTLVDIDLR